MRNPNNTQIAFIVCLALFLVLELIHIQVPNRGTLTGAVGVTYLPTNQQKILLFTLLAQLALVITSVVLLIFNSIQRIKLKKQAIIVLLNLVLALVFVPIIFFFSRFLL